MAMKKNLLTIAVVLSLGLFPRVDLFAIDLNFQRLRTLPTFQRQFLINPGQLRLQTLEECQIEAEDWRNRHEVTRRPYEDYWVESGIGEEIEACYERRNELWESLRECRERREQQTQEPVEGTPGSSGEPSNDVDVTVDTEESIEIYWDDPECHSPKDSELRQACMDSCRLQIRRYRDWIIEIEEWGEPVEHYEGRLARCEERTEEIENQLEEEGCNSGTITVPPAGTCGHAFCR